MQTILSAPQYLQAGLLASRYKDVSDLERVFVLLKPGFLRVVHDVIAKGRQLCRVPHDVVIGFIHPERAFTSEQFVAPLSAHSLDPL